MPEIDSIHNDQVLKRKFLDLASDCPEIYEAANSWFLKQGPDITQELTQGLENDGLGSVCHWRILILLRLFAKKETLPAILKAFYRALERYDPIVLPAAMEALAMFRIPLATDALIPLIRHNNLDIAKQAAALVGKTGDLKVIKPLQHLLESDNASLRYSAVRGLIQSKDSSALAVVIQHLHSETNQEVRNLIISEIGEANTNIQSRPE